jgi:hypothetical protein
MIERGVVRQPVEPEDVDAEAPETPQVALQRDERALPA